MNDTPPNLRFTETHEWLNIDQDSITIGVTQHAQELLGDMVFVELPTIGHEVHAGEELGVLESVKAASDFYAPVSGVVIAVNHLVAENPALVNNDPYGAGWLVKLQIEDPATLSEEITELLDDEEYQNEITKDH